MEQIESVWVLSWRYPDGSGSGVSRAYVSEERANHDKDLLNEAGGMKCYEIEQVPVYR